MGGVWEACNDWWACWLLFFFKVVGFDGFGGFGCAGCGSCLFVGLLVGWFCGFGFVGVVVVGGYLYHDMTIHGRTDLDEVDGQLEEEGEAAEHEGAHDGAQQAELAIPGIWIGMDMGGGCGGGWLDLLLAIPGM